MKVRVSVVIPTYKGHETLSRAIDSVLDQKGFDEYEIVVVDDNLPESEYRIMTEKVMQTYAGDNRVVYIRHPKNLNGSAARNTGARNAKGEYIALLDDDDIFMPDKLRLQVAYMDSHPQFAGSYTWRKNRFGVETKYSKIGDLSKEILLLSFFPTTITLMIRKEAWDTLHGFDESYKRHQDFEFLLRFFELYQIGVVEEVLSQVIGNPSAGNKLEGVKLEQLKSNFLNQFDKAILKIDKEEPGFKNKVYSVNYADVLAGHLSSKHYGLAINLFIRCTKAYRLVFVKQVVIHYYVGLRRRCQYRSSIQSSK